MHDQYLNCWLKLRECGGKKMRRKKCYRLVTEMTEIKTIQSHTDYLHLKTNLFSLNVQVNYESEDERVIIQSLFGKSIWDKFYNWILLEFFFFIHL